MADYDVILIGGGINGLTTAAYLGRAGLKTLVLEARGELGAHCDTVEMGLPGFAYNLHATWLITAMSPIMGDLELDKYGLELRTTEYIYAKTFEDRTNAMIGLDPFQTLASWEKHSKEDSDMMLNAAQHMMQELPDVIHMIHQLFFEAPSQQILDNAAEKFDKMIKKINLNTCFNEIWSMDGFQAADIFYKSDKVKTLMQTLAWIGALPPIQKTVGSVGTVLLGPMLGPIYTVHQAKGGSHALTHALTKAATSYGVKILPCCPVKKILIENGKAVGVQLSEDAVFPNEKITAKTIVSNCTVVPTLIDMVGESNIKDKTLASRIKNFVYSQQNLFGTYLCLSGRPQWASAEFDDGIQRCMMGYFGGDNAEELKKFNTDLVNGVIHDNIYGNWFVPTLADPTQAPEGCHTTFVWVDVPPEPKSWKYGKLDGIKSWDKIKHKLADEVINTYERFAPGFKKLIKDMVIYTPLDQERNNPSAVLGNWVGGSVIPEQFYMNRPVPGVLKPGSGSRTFIDNLFISNSIHPFGATWCASGYIAACEVAEDMGVRKQDWWVDRACSWYTQNMSNIPTNLGVK